MKIFRGSALAAMFLVLLTAAAQNVAAQSKPGDVMITVPFPFIVDGQHMEAGRYIVAPAMESILRISDAHNPHNQIHVPVHSVLGSGKDGARVVFHCYSGACFMSEVWNGSQIGKQFSTSKAEREIISRRSQGARPDEVAVVRPAR
jgi:hypothetical protein